MKLFRSIMLTLALLFAVVAVTDVVQKPAVASAWTASCVFAPSNPSGSYYGGAFCSTTRPGGAFHKVVINCKYTLYGVSHTYNVSGPWVSDSDWSWAYCGNHHKDNNANPDWVIHIHAEFSPSDQYTGGGGSGSW